MMAILGNWGLEMYHFLAIPFAGPVLFTGCNFMSMVVAGVLTIMQHGGASAHGDLTKAIDSYVTLASVTYQTAYMWYRLLLLWLGSSVCMVCS